MRITAQRSFSLGPWVAKDVPTVSSNGIEIPGWSLESPQYRLWALPKRQIHAVNGKIISISMLYKTKSGRLLF